MTDDRQDFVPVEPTPAAGVPSEPVAPAAHEAPAAPPPPPPGYYNPAPRQGQYSAPTPPQYGAPAYQQAPYAQGQYPQGQYPQGQYAYPTYAPAPPPSGLAITSMILGIVSVLLSFAYGFGVFPAIAAVITGHISLKRQPHARGFSLAGLITGYVAILLSLVVIALFVVFIFFIVSNPDTFSDSGTSSDF